VPASLHKMLTDDHLGLLIFNIIDECARLFDCSAFKVLIDDGGSCVPLNLKEFGDVAVLNFVKKRQQKIFFVLPIHIEGAVKVAHLDIYK
jgi:hypothetical protein